MRPFIDINRIPDEDRIFFDDYRQSSYENTAEVHNAYGDSLIILKKVKKPSHTIDETGLQSPRGVQNGRRVDIATGTQPTVTTYGRPKEDDIEYQKISVPGIFIDSSMPIKQVGGGLMITTDPKCRFSKKILDDREITIDPIEDLLMHKGKKFKFRLANDDITYLDLTGELVYELEEI